MPADSQIGRYVEGSGIMGSLVVPLDHDDPDGPTIEAPVWRRRASDPESRIGVLLVNPGGPGFPGSFLVQQSGLIFSDDLQAHFDIVALDPRGTYPETEVNCLDGYGEFVSSVDWSPDSPGETEALDVAIQSWVDDCSTAYSDRLEHVSTMDTVHDMALLVEALGEEQVSYLGFSYGTTLGAAFATTYPELVRVAVFDGAYNRFGDPFQETLDELTALDDLLNRVFTLCDESSNCPIEGAAKAAFGRVSTAADEDPLADEPSLPVINQEAFLNTIRFDDVAYSGSAGPLLQAVAEADAGDSTQLQLLYRNAMDFLEAGGSGVAIDCLDDPHRGLTEVPENALATALDAAPTLFEIFPIPDEFDPFAIAGICERWPLAPELVPTPLSGEGAGPILVVSATGDPVTNTASATRFAEDLANGTLLLVEDDQHVSYERDSANLARRCATQHIDAFLIDLTIPPADTICG